MCKPKKKPAHVLVLVHFCFRFSAAGKEMKDRAAFCRVVSSLVPRGAKNNGAGSSWGNTAAMFSSARNSSPIPVYHGVGQCGCGYLKEFLECVSRLILTDSYMDSQAKCIPRGATPHAPCSSVKTCGRFTFTPNRIKSKGGGRKTLRTTPKSLFSTFQHLKIEYTYIKKKKDFYLTISLASLVP